MNRVKVTNDTGLPKLDFTAWLHKPRKYKPLDPVAKQEEVLRQETAIRNAAWQAGKLNPLIGTDLLTSEPLWDMERNIL